MNTSWTEWEYLLLTWLLTTRTDPPLNVANTNKEELPVGYIQLNFVILKRPGIHIYALVVLVGKLWVLKLIPSHFPEQFLLQRSLLYAESSIHVFLALWVFSKWLHHTTMCLKSSSHCWLHHGNSCLSAGAGVSSSSISRFWPSSPCNVTEICFKQVIVIFCKILHAVHLEAGLHHVCDILTPSLQYFDSVYTVLSSVHLN